MERFIAPDELARDRRFKRARSRNQLLRSLPDDVDTVVRVLEKIAPKILERIRGTALEPVFDELGPGFSFLTTTSGSRTDGERTPTQVWEAIQRHHEALVQTSRLETQRREHRRREFFDAIESWMEQQLQRLTSENHKLGALLQQVEEGRRDPYAAALTLLSDATLLKRWLASLQQ